MPLVALELDETNQPDVFLNSTLVRLVHFWNAYLPMLVTLSGITTLVRLVQPEKALEPMLVMLSGITILVRLVQPENA